MFVSIFAAGKKKHLRATVFVANLGPSYGFIRAEENTTLLIKRTKKNRTDHCWLIEIRFLSAASCVLWITSCSLLTVLWAFVIGLLGELSTLLYNPCHLFIILFNCCFPFLLNINASRLPSSHVFCDYFILAATILHASFRTPNLKARLNTFREEFRAVWRNYSEL